MHNNSSKFEDKGEMQEVVNKCYKHLKRKGMNGLQTGHEMIYYSGNKSTFLHFQLLRGNSLSSEPLLTNLWISAPTSTPFPPAPFLLVFP